MAQQTSSHQPRISRETRRLLIAAPLALVVLWMLVQVRSVGDTPPRPVQPLLSQLVARSAFSDLAAEVSRVQARLQPFLLLAKLTNGGNDPTTSGPDHVAALRVGDTLAVALLSRGTSNQPRDLDLVAADAASGLMLVSVPSADSFAAMEWASPRSQGPQYVFVTVPSAVGVALRPVFIPGLDMVTRRTWSGLVWKATPGTDLDPGAFVFTTAGDFAGLVIDDAGDRVIVGGDVLRAEIDVLRNRPPRARGELGLEVQVLTPAIASATGSSGGVVVTWVDPEGAAGGILAAGDVIEWVDGARAASEEWAFRSGRVTVDEMITLRVRRKREVQEIGLVARSPAAPRIETLGLTLRALPGVGSEVIRVVARGAGERAGVKPGDVITRAGNAQTPTPSQIRATYAADQEQRGVLIALTRGITHHVAVLER